MNSIIVDEELYRYGISQNVERRSASDELHTTRCLSQDTFTAYLARQRISPLHIHFQVEEDSVRGSPLRTGMPMSLNNPASSSINIHTPAVAAALIRYARAAGWQPSQTRAPYLIENGVEILVALGYGVE